MQKYVLSELWVTEAASYEEEVGGRDKVMKKLRNVTFGCSLTKKTNKQQKLIKHQSHIVDGRCQTHFVLSKIQL